MSTRDEPKLPRARRAVMPEGTAATVLKRQAVWSLTAALIAGGTLALWEPPAWAALGLPVGLGLMLAYLPRPGQGLRAALGVLAASAMAATLDLSAVWIVGAAAGFGAASLVALPSLPTRALHGALAGGAGSSLLVFAALDPILSLPWPTSVSVQVAIGTFLVSLGASQALWATHLKWSSADRVPSPAQIRATLSAEHQEACIRAWNLDQALAAKAPDAETRDGLGEVAAWVYRLSWVMQALGRELAALDPEKLDSRVETARASMERADDALTREPRAATVRHLEQLAAHRDALILERQRTSALIEYALAFLEQARAGLALARVRPGEGMPERLGDVLDRLRTQTVEGDARRATARQLTPLA